MTSKILGDCASCARPAMSYTGATTTTDGGFLCGPCTARVKESLKPKTRPAPARVTARRKFPEPPPVDGARWLQLGDRRLALVDAADYERASSKNWFLLGGHVVRREIWGGAVRHDFLERFILGIDPGESGQLIDFIDQNPLNCRRSNLRVAHRTPAQ